MWELIGVGLVAAGFFIWWTRYIYRVGVKWGKLSGYTDGLNAHKELEEMKQRRQRDEWIDYIQSRELPDEVKGEEDTDDPI